jgi:arsenate reductase (glutaredoxin)
MKVYHNSRCKKSRAGLQYLEEKNVTVDVIQYLKDDAFTFDSLKSLLKKMGKKPHDMIRTQEKEYKEKYKGKDLSDDEWIQVMVDNPKFIQRPIVETEDKAVWGDPPQNIDEIL